MHRLQFLSIFARRGSWIRDGSLARVFVCVWGILAACHVGTVLANPPRGSIVGWGSQVIAEDLSQGFIAVAAEGLSSLGVKTDGSIVVWGGIDFSQRNVPAPNTNFIAVAAGGNHSLGLRVDGSIVVWGSSYFGQRNVPAPNTGFMAVAAGWNHNLGLKIDGSIVAWGNDLYGGTDVPAPNTGFVAIAAGWTISLGIQTVCTPGDASCDDKNVCTNDRCDPAIGTCVNTYNRKPCGDGLYCTKPDRCEDGFCVGTPRRCPGAKPATKN